MHPRLATILAKDLAALGKVQVATSWSWLPQWPAVSTLEYQPLLWASVSYLQDEELDEVTLMTSNSSILWFHEGHVSLSDTKTISSQEIKG